MIDFRNFRHEQRATAAMNQASRAKDRADQVKGDLDGIQRQLDHLTLLCQSMWEVLRDETGLSDGQLRAKIADVDTRDGKADGKINAQIFACPSCGANCNTSRQHCTMCGEDLKQHKPHLFEA